jgi:peptidoglycan/xylan/chitin deacetylase (PgdA/CDA1 family)
MTSYSVTATAAQIHDGDPADLLVVVNTSSVPADVLVLPQGLRVRPGQRVTVEPNGQIVSAMTFGGLAPTGTIDVTVSANPSRQTDNITFSKAFSGTRKGVVIFSWDDGYAIHATLADEAEKRGQRHTFFITGNRPDSAGGLTSAQIRDLSQRGHEIGNHSQTHPTMTGLTAAQRATEWSTSQAVLAAITGNTPKAMTYPAGARNTTTDREAYSYFRNISWIGTGGDFPTTYPLSGYPPVGHARLAWGSNAYTLQLARQLVRLAATQPVIVHLFGHRPDSPGTFNDPTLAEVLSVMDLCQSLQIPVMTVSDAFGGGGPVMNPHFDDGLDGWLTSVNGGGAVSLDSSVNQTPPAGFTWNQSVKFTNAAATVDNAAVVQTVPVTPGATYSVSCRGKTAITSGANGLGLWATFFDAYNAAVEYTPGSTTIFGTQLTGTTAWSAMSLSQIAPAGARWLQIKPILVNAQGTGWINNMHVGETGYGSFG